MPSIVTLDVYSGRPNPTWIIEDDQLTQLRDLGAMETAARLGPLPVLGYRGFQVRPIESEHAPASRIEGMPESAPGAGDATVTASPAAEEFLLSTAGPHIDGELRGFVEQAITRGFDRELIDRLEAARAAKCPTCHAADAPVYNPAYWNTASRQPHNNCYNYANDQATNSFAQPGRASGHMYTALTCQSVQPAATSDGLRACANFAGPLQPGQGWYVALVIWPGNDYHWYRQDKVGCWSHKPGGTAARNTDNAGHAILDPRSCNRGPYTTFCTYMITTRGVRIR